MLLRSLAIATIGLGIGVAATTIADAYPAQTTRSVNVRAGPGTGFGKIGVLYAYTPIDVRYCQPNWCSVSFGWGSGRIFARYIAGAYFEEPIYRPYRPYRPRNFFWFGNPPYPPPDSDLPPPGIKEPNSGM